MTDATAITAHSPTSNTDIIAAVAFHVSLTADETAAAAAAVSEAGIISGLVADQARVLLQAWQVHSSRSVPGC